MLNISSFSFSFSQNIESAEDVDGWMFELFIDAQPQKGIQRLNDYKNTILHNELGWKKTKEIQD